MWVRHGWDWFRVGWISEIQVLKLGKSPTDHRTWSTFDCLAMQFTSNQRSCGKSLATKIVVFEYRCLANWKCAFEGCDACISYFLSLIVGISMSNSPWLQRQHRWLRKTWSWKAHPQSQNQLQLFHDLNTVGMGFWASPPWPYQMGHLWIQVNHTELQTELHRWHPVSNWIKIHLAFKTSSDSSASRFWFLWKWAILHTHGPALAFTAKNTRDREDAFFSSPGTASTGHNHNGWMSKMANQRVSRAKLMLWRRVASFSNFIPFLAICSLILHTWNGYSYPSPTAPSPGGRSVEFAAELAA